MGRGLGIRFYFLFLCWILDFYFRWGGFYFIYSFLIGRREVGFREFYFGVFKLYVFIFLV